MAPNEPKRQRSIALTSEPTPREEVDLTNPPSGIRMRSDLVPPARPSVGRAAVKPRHPRSAPPSSASTAPPPSSTAAAPAPLPSAPGYPLKSPAPAPSSKTQAFRSLLATREDWPLVPEAARSSSLGAASKGDAPEAAPGPKFGRPPPGAPDPSRFSLPAFLPPAAMMLAAKRPANHNALAAPAAPRGALAEVAPLEVPVDIDLSEMLGVRRRWQIPTPVAFALGVAAGVVATLLLH